MNLKNILTIFKKEFNSFFITPIAYFVITIFLLIIGLIFFNTFFFENTADLRSFFSLLPLAFCIAIPVITMRLFAEEFRSGSYEILATLPVSRLDIIASKYLAAVSVVVIMLIPTVSYPIFISFVGDLDIGPIIGGFLGAVFMGAAYCAIGIFASSISKNQIIAVITSFLICFALFMIDKLNILYFIPGFLINFFQNLGMDYHFRNIAKGVVDTRDILYFLSISFISLYATYFVLKEKND